MKRARSGAVLMLSLATVLGTAGCYQGEGHTVSSQGPSGNGTTFTVSDQIEVHGLTVVADGQGRGSVVMTIVNSGTEADALLALGTDPATTLTVSRPSPTPAAGPAPTPAASPVSDASAEPMELVSLPAEQAVHIGAPGSTRINLADLKTPAGSYLTVALAFGRAGSTRQQVLVAPDTGFYADYGPTASASPSPAPSPSPSGEGTIVPLPAATSATPSVSAGPGEQPSPTQ